MRKHGGLWSAHQWRMLFVRRRRVGSTYVTVRVRNKRMRITQRPSGFWDKRQNEAWRNLEALP